MNETANNQVEYDGLEAKLNYVFTNQQLLKQALTHRSHSRDSNERLEFLGDAVLQLVISDYLYQTYPTMNEGMLSGIRASLVSKNGLIDCAYQLDLFQYIRVSTAERKGTNPRSKNSVAANTLEAIIGAIYLDGGLSCCQQLIIKLYHQRLQDISTNHNFKDAKSTLQEIVQAEYRDTPLYKLLATHGKPHQRTFTVSCSLPSFNKPFIGEGASRKEAEQIAAHLALQHINKG